MTYERHGCLGSNEQYEELQVPKEEIPIIPFNHPET